MHEDQIRRLLRQVDEPASPDPAFADQLFDRLTREAGGSRSSHLVLLLVAAVMLVSVLAVGAAIGSGLVKVPWFTVEVSPAPSGVAISSEEATPSAIASATPSASPTPTPAPTPVIAVPDGLLPPRSKATVMVDALRVRQQPSTSAQVLTTLNKGDTVTIDHSITTPVPVIVDGVPWYSLEDASNNTLLGWVAAQDADTSFLALAEPTTCEDLRPGPVTLQQLIAADSWHRLACLGDTPVTVTGVYVISCQGGTWDPSTFGPHWLIDPCPGQLLTPQEGARNSPGANALDTVPAAELGVYEQPGTIARVTGHFDDAASATCFMNFNKDATWTVVSGAAALDCREQFVVTKIEVLGSLTLPPI